MPSLFTGAAVGTGFALLVEPVWGISTLNSGAFAVVGMAAMFAVVGRAPLTAILLVFEVTGARDYQLILPLMLTATLATFLAERFHPDSVYSMALKNMGISVRRTGGGGCPRHHRRGCGHDPSGGDRWLRMTIWVTSRDDSMSTSPMALRWWRTVGWSGLSPSPTSPERGARGKGGSLARR